VRSPSAWLGPSVLALFLGACAGPSGHKPGAQMSAGHLTYLALGDSYTIGESVSESERWPNQLAGLLRARGMPVASPVIVAKTGWTTDELAAAIPGRSREWETFSLVTLLIGVNNQYRGRDLEEYRAQFTDLLHQAIGFAGGQADRVVVLSIPDWGVTPFAEGRNRAKIASEIDRFNGVNREETARAGARYVDVTPISRRVPGDRGLVAGDGLHPSGKQYAEWASLALPEAMAALASKESK
jgi:lysophospholipase L1-like esterase